MTRRRPSWSRRRGDGERTLVIIGDTLHHRDQQGRLCTHAALASQLDLWAAHFDQVRFCGVLGEGPPPGGFAPYRATNVELVPLRGAGGTGLRAKLVVALAACSWLATLVPALRSADGVHLRTPCNVTIPTLVLAPLLVRNRYAIFAGSWHPYIGEPWSYRLQRWLLRRWFGGVVHAYLPADEAPDRPNVRRGFSPVMDAASLEELSVQAAAGHAGHGARPLRIISVGRFSANKNQIVLVDAVGRLEEAGMSVEVRFIGDGADARAVRAAAEELPNVEFIASASHEEVLQAMAWADLNVLPSFREGFPKVLLEGLSAGALPVASDTPMNRAMSEVSGWVFDPASTASLVAVIEAAAALDPGAWDARRSHGLDFARQHTLDAFGREIDLIVNQIWT